MLLYRAPVKDFELYMKDPDAYMELYRWTKEQLKVHYDAWEGDKQEFFKAFNPPQEDLDELNKRLEELLGIDETNRPKVFPR